MARMSSRLLLFLFSVGAFAQCPSFAPVDLFLDFNGASVGTAVSTTNLAGGTEIMANAYGLGWQGTDNGGTLGASFVALPGSVSIRNGATLPCGYATQSYVHDNSVDATGGHGSMSLVLPTGLHIVTVSGWITVGPPDISPSGHLNDNVVVGGWSGKTVALFQLQTGSNWTCGQYAVEMENSDPGNGTTHSTCIPLTPGSTYYFTGQVDRTALQAHLNVYTTAGGVFTLIPGGSVTSSITGTDTIGSVHLGDGEFGTASGTSTKFQNIMIDYTNHVWPNLPTGGSTPLWTNILSPVWACGTGGTSTPGACGIDWSDVGIPGGIPSESWSQSGSTISPTGSDQTAAIQAALNACSGTSKYVLLATGTFQVNGFLVVPDHCVLRGSGANLTILNAVGGSTGGDSYPPNVIKVGADATPSAASPNVANDVSITAGATAGSGTIVVSSAANIAVGGYLRVTELNDSAYVTQNGSEGACSYCDQYSGARVRGQIVEVVSKTGTTIGIAPALYTNYSHTPLATPFVATAKYAGVENLQVYSNHLTCGTATGVCYGGDFGIGLCAYCWLRGVEGNYTDANFVSFRYGYRDEVRDSYFSNAFTHGAGSYDADLSVAWNTSASLVQNNIIERAHVGIMLELGVAGNVIGHNYMIGNYVDGSTNFNVSAINAHGAHPQFNLIEGNITPNFDWDSIHGSHSDQTMFRNWSLGTTKLCSIGFGAARGVVTCASTWGVQHIAALRLGFNASNYNSIGNVLGSLSRAALTRSNLGVTPITQISTVSAICGSVPCGEGSRSYDHISYTYDLGFGESSDDGTGGSTNGSGCGSSYAYPCHSIAPLNTLFSHGDYDGAAASISWSGSITHTMPASFYLLSKPAWWGSIPWPAIGPDVTGGLSNAYGHVYAIPAEVCYESVMGGTDGTGSPSAFNADACYAGTPVTGSKFTGKITGVIR